MILRFAILDGLDGILARAIIKPLQALKPKAFSPCERNCSVSRD
jgi:hypothetical protein